MPEGSQVIVEMPADNQIIALRRPYLEIPKESVPDLAEGKWLVNPKGLRELIVSCETNGSSFKSLSNVGGHIKIIKETDYMKGGVSPDKNDVLFKAIRSEKFIQNEKGYDRRAKLMKDAGYDMNKLGGGFKVCEH